MNYLDSDIQDYPDEITVDDIYADGDDSVAPYDQRWRPVAAIAGIIFVLAVIATVVIVNGGDSASTSATVVAPPRSAAPRPSLVPALPPEVDVAWVEDRLAEREAARAAKDWELADRMRAELTQAGIRVEDTPEGTHWYWSGGA